MEGTHPYDGGENPDGAVLPDLRVRPRPGAARSPAATCTAARTSPGSQGAYLFADYCGTGVRGLQVDGGTVIDTANVGSPGRREYSFGEDDDGELYVLLAGGRVVKLVTPERAVEAAG